jgi:16S rRNA (cytidine1402-2'-O)-methyltransferase
MLYIVSTPIGNLGDITHRAVDVLGRVDTVLAEDTRVTRKLLNHIDVRPKVERFDEHTAYAKTPGIVARVLAGEEIALVSDAGTPGISDPGQMLVDAVLKAKEGDTNGFSATESIIDETTGSTSLDEINSRSELVCPNVSSSSKENGFISPVPQKENFVTVIPGSSAVIGALTASGLSSDAFYFGGFLPRKEKARCDSLETLASLDATLIFYESPLRLVKTLESCVSVLGNRKAAVVRELTKLHEEVIRAPLQGLVEEFNVRDSIKGELVIVIAPPIKEKVRRVHVDKYKNTEGNS